MRPHALRKVTAVGLDTVEFVLWAEEEFGVTVPDADAATIATVGEFCRYLVARLALKDGIHAISYRQVFDKVSARLESEYGVRRQLITDQARFVEDLGLQ